MDFQSVRKKTDWKSILRFAKPHIISGQILSRNFQKEKGRIAKCDTPFFYCNGRVLPLWFCCIYMELTGRLAPFR